MSAFGIGGPSSAQQPPKKEEDPFAAELGDKNKKNESFEELKVTKN